MVKWINVNSKKISRIAYNPEVKTMFIDFKGSVVDTPYAGVNQVLFESFTNAEDIDEYYEAFIKKECEVVELDTENVINVNFREGK